LLRLLTLIIGGMLLGLVVSEALARALLPEKSEPQRIHAHFHFDSNGLFRIDPRASGWHRGYDGPPIFVQINSKGFRGAEPRPDAHPRVVMLGDSIVFDGGVPLEDTFVALAEKRLREQFPKIQLFNLGTTDVGLDQYVLQLREGPVSPLRPTLIVVSLYLNDTCPPQGLAAAVSDPILRSLDLPGVRSLRVFDLLRRWYVLNTMTAATGRRFRWVPRFLRRRWVGDPQELQLLTQEADEDWGAAWKPNFSSVAQGYLEQARELSARAGASLAVLLFPASPQVYAAPAPAWLFHPQTSLKQVLGQLHVPTLDLLPILREQREQSLFNDQCHLNRAGNHLVADVLSRWLSELLESCGSASSPLPSRS
jgi:lysophospholipase L1-like esterase